MATRLTVLAGSGRIADRLLFDPVFELPVKNPSTWMSSGDVLKSGFLSAVLAHLERRC